MKQFGQKLLLLGIIALAPLYPLARFYDSRLQSYTAEKGIWVLSLKNGNYDYAVTGNSRVVNVVSVNDIDSRLGTHGINIGVGGSDFADNLLLLKKFYDSGNRVKLLMIQTDLMGMINPNKAYTHPFNDQNFLFLIGDPSVDSIICANTNPLKHPFRKFIPFFKYAEYNNIFPLNTVIKGFRESADFQKYGGSSLPAENSSTHKIKPVKKELVYNDLDPVCAFNLEAIVRLAREHGTRVLFFTSPTYSEYISKEVQDGPAKDSIRSIAGKYGISYFDFESAAISKQISYFRDYNHLDAEGAHLFSTMLADSLSKNNLPGKK